MEHLSGIRLLFLIAGIYLGIFLGIIMLFLKSKQNKANLFLGMVLLCFVSFMLPRFIYELGLLEMMPHVFRIEIFTSFALGPVMYFYVRACTQKDFRFTPMMWLHFLPLLLDLILHIPIFSLSGFEKIELLTNRINMEGLGEYPIPIAFKSIHASIYVVLAIQLVFQYKNHVENTASNINRSLHRWLLSFCGILLVPLIALVMFTILAEKIQKFGIIGFSIFFFINAVLIAIIFNPMLFHAFPHQISMAEIQEDKKHSKKEKIENSNLQQTQRKKLSKQLINHIETDKPYQEPELTIAQLAQQLKIQPYHLSQTINQNMGCTFLDFINGYRIKEAKSKLIDAKYRHFTIIAIAYEVGFNSKTAFYSAFKKHVGTTPSHYRKSAMSNEQ